MQNEGIAIFLGQRTDEKGSLNQIQKSFLHFLNFSDAGLNRNEKGVGDVKTDYINKVPPNHQT